MNYSRDVPADVFYPIRLCPADNSMLLNAPLHSQIPHPKRSRRSNPSLFMLGSNFGEGHAHDGISIAEQRRETVEVRDLLPFS
jgi:hypothetical protein